MNLVLSKESMPTQKTAATQRIAYAGIPLPTDFNGEQVILRRQMASAPFGSQTQTNASINHETWHPDTCWRISSNVSCRYLNDDVTYQCYVDASIMPDDDHLTPRLARIGFYIRDISNAIILRSELKHKLMNAHQLFRLKLRSFS